MGFQTGTFLSNDSSGRKNSLKIFVHFLIIVVFNHICQIIMSKREKPFYFEVIFTPT